MDTVNAGTLGQLLNAGISVGAVEYRFISHAFLPAAHHDRQNIYTQSNLSMSIADRQCLTKRTVRSLAGTKD